MLGQTDSRNRYSKWNLLENISRHFLQYHSCIGNSMIWRYIEAVYRRNFNKISCYRITRICILRTWLKHETGRLICQFDFCLIGKEGRTCFDTDLFVYKAHYEISWSCNFLEHVKISLTCNLLYRQWQWIIYRWFWSRQKTESGGFDYFREK